MEQTINTAYKLITTQVDQNDIYYINPFDKNGFLMNQMNIDIRLDVWSGNSIIVYLPEIASLQGNYNFTVNITAVYDAEVGEPTRNAVVSGGNNQDNWNDGQIYNYQVMSWTPISMIDDRSGFYAVNPYNNNVFNAVKTLDAQSTETLSNVDAFKNLLETAKQ